MDSEARQEVLHHLFLDSCTNTKWLAEPAPTQTLHELYALARMAPTAMNSRPMRLMFVVGAEGMRRLQPALSQGNVAKVTAAPVTATVAYDSRFYDCLLRKV